MPCGCRMQALKCIVGEMKGFGMPVYEFQEFNASLRKVLGDGVKAAV